MESNHRPAGPEGPAALIPLSYAPGGIATAAGRDESRVGRDRRDPMICVAYRTSGRLDTAFLIVDRSTIGATPTAVA